MYFFSDSTNYFQCSMAGFGSSPGTAIDFFADVRIGMLAGGGGSQNCGADPSHPPNYVDGGAGGGAGGVYITNTAQRYGGNGGKSCCKITSRLFEC